MPTYDKTMRTQYPCPRCSKMILVGFANGNVGGGECDACYGRYRAVPPGPGGGMEWPADYIAQVDALNRHSTQQEEA